MMTTYYLKKVEALIKKRLAASGKEDLEDYSANGGNQVVPEEIQPI